MRVLHTTGDWKWTGPAEPMLHAVRGLRALGYDGHFVQRGRLVPVGEFRPDLNQRLEPGPFRRTRDYSNNFILRRA